MEIIIVCFFIMIYPKTLSIGENVNSISGLVTLNSLIISIIVSSGFNKQLLKYNLYLQFIFYLNICFN